MVMLPSYLFRRCISIYLVLACLVASASSYFVVNTPSSNVAWVNGQSNLMTWTKGVQDGVEAFDLEMARLTVDGLIYVGMNVPASSSGSINVYIEDLPSGDDYFLVCINSTGGTLFGTSSRFTVLDASSTIPSNYTTTVPLGSAVTVSISGSPSPTMQFATTFPAPASGALVFWQKAWTSQLIGIMSALCVCLTAGVWTVW